MGQLMLTLNGKEEELLEDATPNDGFSRQDFIRALLLMASNYPTLFEKAQKRAAKGEKLLEQLKHRPGQAKGLSEEDYREAVHAEGTIKGAAEALGVARTTVREQCVRYNIYVPSLGDVPE